MRAQGAKPRDFRIMRQIDTDNDQLVTKTEYYDFIKKWLYGSSQYTDSVRLLQASHGYKRLSFWEREDTLTRQVDQYFL